MWSTTGALTLLVAGAFAVAWGGYFRWKDHGRPEPLSLLAAVLGGGIAAAGLALAGFHGLDLLGRPVEWDALAFGRPWLALVTAAAIGLVEESAKLVPLLLVAQISAHFDERLDGAIYAGCSGVGFALAETALHIAHGETLGSLWPRIVAAPIAHGLLLAPAGLGFAFWKLERRTGLLAAGLATSVLTHGLYDLLLARYPWGPPASSALIGLLWAGFIALCPRLTTPRSITEAPAVDPLSRRP